MIAPHVNIERGRRLKMAMERRGYRKATALAAALNISPAAMTKWTQGYTMSIAHACHLAELLNVSLDWLLMGRNSPDWFQPDHLNEVELDLLAKLRERPTRITGLFIRLAAEISKIPVAEPLEPSQP
jgi:transcriptional regulator with XRE-family HTH domain